LCRTRQGISSIHSQQIPGRNPKKAPHRRGFSIAKQGYVINLIVIAFHREIDHFIIFTLINNDISGIRNDKIIACEFVQFDVGEPRMEILEVIPQNLVM
jgi:hypothetical protein